MNTKRFILFLFGVLLLHAANAQQNISVCYNGNTTVSFTDASTTDKYLWQTQNTGSSVWTTVKNWSTDKFVNLSNLTTSLQVRYLRDADDDQIAEDTTVIANIVVYPDIQKAIITTATNSICYNAAPAAISIQTPASGGNSIFSNQWQVKNGAVWSDITGETANSYQPAKLTQTTQYRLKSISGCGEVFSNEITISVYPQINAGVINGSQTICYGIAPNLFSFTTNPSGEGNTYTYQWQSSTNGTTFSNISNASNNTYQAGNLTTTTYYRVVVTSQTCGTSDESNVIQVTVRPEFVAGAISNAQTICYDTAPNQLTGTNCSGGDGIYLYQWERSTNGTNFSNATGTGATSLNFTPAALTQTSYFRLRYTSGSNCGTVYSNVIQVFVYPDIQAATITTATNSICYNTAPAAISIQTPASGGNGIFSNQWQVKNGTVWSNITGETANSYQPAKLTQTTQYRLKSTSGCGEVFSNEITIAVYPQINAGVINGTQTICYSTAPNLFTFTTNPNGAGDSYFYQWQSSTNGTTFSNISNAVNNTCQAGDLTAAIYYRAVVTSQICGTSDTSNAITVTVRPEFITGQIAGIDTVCYDTKPNQLTMIQNCSGGDGNFSYQWQSSTNGINFSNISNATNQNYQPPALTQTNYFRLQFTSGNNCGVLHSDTIYVFVNPLPAKKTLDGSIYVCSNQSDVQYSTKETEKNIDYQWFVSDGTITEGDNSAQISVHWNNQAGTGVLTLLQTNIITGCQLTTAYYVEKTENAAPGKTHILKKYNSNILICEENSPNIIYEWGFADLQTGIAEIIPESNCRYMQFPHRIDTTKYDYFVTTTFSYGNNKSCSTTTFYSEVVNTSPQQCQCEISFAVYPNPAKNNFSVKLDGEKISNFTISMYSLLGGRIFTQQYSDYNLAAIPFDLNLPKGIYLINVQTEEVTTTQKIVIE